MSDDWRERKVTVKVARRILGKVGNTYSDKQLRKILECLYNFSEFFIHKLF